MRATVFVYFQPLIHRHLRCATVEAGALVAAELCEAVQVHLQVDNDALVNCPRRRLKVRVARGRVEGENQPHVVSFLDFSRLENVERPHAQARPISLAAGPKSVAIYGHPAQLPCLGADSHFRVEAAALPEVAAETYGGAFDGLELRAELIGARRCHGVQ